VVLISGVAIDSYIKGVEIREHDRFWIDKETKQNAKAAHHWFQLSRQSMALSANPTPRGQR